MNESNIFGLSIRGIIAMIVMLSLCFACVWHIDDTKVGILKDMAILVLTFYFSQKGTQTGGSNAPNTTSTSTTINTNTTADPSKS